MVLLVVVSFRVVFGRCFVRFGCVFFVGFFRGRFVGWYICLLYKVGGWFYVYFYLSVVFSIFFICVSAGVLVIFCFCVIIFRLEGYSLGMWVVILVCSEYRKIMRGI